MIIRTYFWGQVKLVISTLNTTYLTSRLLFSLFYSFPPRIDSSFLSSLPHYIAFPPHHHSQSYLRNISLSTPHESPSLSISTDAFIKIVYNHISIVITSTVTTITTIIIITATFIFLRTASVFFCAPRLLNAS